MIDLIKKREKQAAYFESNTITQGEYIEIIDRAIAAEEELENMREERKELASSKEEWHRKWMYSDSKRERAEAKLAELRGVEQPDSEAPKPAAYAYPEFFDCLEKSNCATAYRFQGDPETRIPLYLNQSTNHKPQRITEQDARDILLSAARKNPLTPHDIGLFLSSQEGRNLLEKLNEHRDPDYRAQRDLLLTALKFHQSQTRTIQFSIDVLAQCEGEIK